MSKGSSNKRKIIAFAVTMLCIVTIIALFLGNFGSSLPLEDEFDISSDFVRFIDVGQGDSILIYSNGYSALIDTGTSDSANEICSMLDECNIKDIDVVILSHLHDDHTGGIKQISEIHKIKNIILPEISIESDTLTDAQFVINKVRQTGGGIYNAVSGMNFSIGEFEITVLASFGEMKDENNRSVIVAAEIEERKFLFTGDAETKTETALLNEGLNLKCDVLKAGHHGSNTSSSEEFLKAVSPRFVAISVGRENSYGHPHNTILSAYEKIKAEVYRTDYDGDITFSIEDGNLKVKTEK